MQELVWEAEYMDGIKVLQYENGVENSTAGLDRDRLKLFRLFSDKGCVFEAHFDKERGNRKLIFRRRNLCGPSGELLNVVYLVGWHENIKGVSTKAICYIYGDGHVEFDDDRSNLELFDYENFS